MAETGRKLTDDTVDEIANKMVDFIQEYFGYCWSDKNEQDIYETIVDMLLPYSNGERNWN